MPSPRRQRDILFDGHTGGLAVTIWTRFVFPAFVFFVGLGLAQQAAISHEGEDGAGTTITPVISAELSEAAGKHATMVTVSIEPGAHFDPHRHPGTVLVYVLEGEIESALDDEEPKTFKAGEAWSEYAGALHRVTRNGSELTAKILAVLLHDKDAPLQLPAD